MLGPCPKPQYFASKKNAFIILFVGALPQAPIHIGPGGPICRANQFTFNTPAKRFAGAIR